MVLGLEGTAVDQRLLSILITHIHIHSFHIHIHIHIHISISLFQGFANRSSEFPRFAEARSGGTALAGGVFVKIIIIIDSINKITNNININNSIIIICYV